MYAQALTQNGTTLLQVVRPQFATVLAKPWHFRRHGRYYLRLRPRNQTHDLFTVSLRTTDRTFAMELSQNIQRALALFQLDKPDATWPELKEQLTVIAEELLELAHGDESIFVHSEAYREMYNALRQASSRVSLTAEQHRALGMGKAILKAANARLEGNSEALSDIVRQLKEEASPVSVSVGGKEERAPITFRQLADLYMAEQVANVEASTMRDIRSTCAGLADVLGNLDLRGHTREDLVAAKATLLETRKASTVNKFLTRLSTVLSWAVNNGYIERSFDKRLKATKGADSSRVPFSQEQVQRIMAYANGLEGSSWARWGLSLGTLTGARIAEIRQITKSDIQRIGECWVIDINAKDGKSLKNRSSARLVPLVVGAYDFDLGAFLQFVDKLPEGAPLFNLSAGRFSEVLNGALRDVLGVGADRVQSFHSLRHSLASLLKSQGIAVGVAQSILGHSSQSITFVVVY